MYDNMPGIEEVFEFVTNERKLKEKRIAGGSYKDCYDFSDSFVLLAAKYNDDKGCEWLNFLIDKNMIEGSEYILDDNAGSFWVVEKLELIYSMKYLPDDVFDLVSELSRHGRVKFINLFGELFPEWIKLVSEFYQIYPRAYFDFRPPNIGYRKETGEPVFFDIINLDILD